MTVGVVTHGSAEAPSANKTPHHDSGRAWYALAVLGLTMVATISFRQMLLLVLQPLKIELHLSDASAGFLIGSAPTLISGLFVFMVGWLSDRTPRHWVAACCISACAVSMACFALAQSYVLVLVAVTVLITAETGLNPVVNSLIPDLISPGRRALVNVVYSGAIGVCYGLTFAIAGLLITLAHHAVNLPTILKGASDWRVACFFAAVCGVPLAVACLSIGTVTRGHQGHVEPHEKLELLAFVREQWPNLRVFFTTMTLFSLGGVVAGMWIPTAISRTFAVTPAQVGEHLAVAVTGAAIGGFCLSAMLTLIIGKQLIAKQHRTNVSTVIFRWMSIGAALPCAGYAFATTAQQFYLLFCLQLTLQFAAAAHVGHLLQTLSSAMTRGRISAFYAIFSSVMTAPGAWLVGFISDSFHNSPRGLVLAIAVVASPAYLMSAFCLRVRQPAAEPSSMAVPVTHES